MNIELKSLKEIGDAISAYLALPDPQTKAMMEFVWQKYKDICHELSKLPDETLHKWALDNGYTKTESK